MYISGTEVISLIVGCLITAALACGLYLLKRKSALSQVQYAIQQTTIGVIFGAVAVFCTEYAMHVGSDDFTVRNAVPLCTGIFFGPTAGFVSGLIAGVERWLAVGWGASYYTRIADTAAVVLSGIYAGFLRIYVFERKRPSWLLAFFTGVVMETVHMIILFLVHLKDPAEANYIISTYTVPLAIANGVTCLLTDQGITRISKRIHKEEQRMCNITQRLQTYLLLNVILAYVLSILFVFNVQTYTSVENAENIMRDNNLDVEQEIRDAADDRMISVARQVAHQIDKYPGIDLYSLAEEFDVTDIWIVDTEGIVTRCTDGNVGYDMNSDADLPEDQRQSSDFMILLTGETDEYVQRYMPLASQKVNTPRKDSDASSEAESEDAARQLYGKGYGNEVKRKLAGVTLQDGGFVQIGYNAGKLQKKLEEEAEGLTKNRRVGESGYIIIANEKGKIISNRENSDASYLTDLGIAFGNDLVLEKAVKANVDGTDSYMTAMYTDGFYIISVMPDSEIFETRSATTYINSFLEIIIFATLFINIAILIRTTVVRDLNKVNIGLSRITEGELDTSIDVRTSEEFIALSDGVNTTVGSLKKYIDDAEGRIDKELAFARDIQHAVLPSVFPPYPDRKQFDIFAAMHTAKEVGGDFYDFFMPDDKHIAIVIADVSGKGIPAAMFMMTAKTMLKNLAEMGIPVNKVFEDANEKLCVGNEAGMFVTAWLGILDTETGHMEYVNAGHNPPVIYRQGKGFEYLRQRPGFILAGMEGMRYKKSELDLEPGDRVFLYTDGATEAINTSGTLYGEDRLLKYLNSNSSADATRLIGGVKRDIDRFVGEAEQFDDITMLILDYNGSEPGGKVYIASDDALSPASEYIEEILAAGNVSPKDINMILVAFEELFVNIAHYAYPGSQGNVSVFCEVVNGWAVVRLTDTGIRFDPFINKDPDITLDAGSRSIGGLGIFMTKQIMDEYEYKYSAGRNIVTVKKKV